MRSGISSVLFICRPPLGPRTVPGSWWTLNKYFWKDKGGLVNIEVVLRIRGEDGKEEERDMRRSRRGIDRDGRVRPHRYVHGVLKPKATHTQIRSPTEHAPTPLHTCPPTQSPSPALCSALHPHSTPLPGHGEELFQVTSLSGEGDSTSSFSKLIWLQSPL